MLTPFAIDFTDEQKKDIYRKCNCGFHPLDCFAGCCIGTGRLIKAVLNWLFLPKQWKDFWKEEKVNSKI